MSSILFVDPRIPDCQSFIKDLDPNLGLVVVIDPNRDGVVQITETLKLGSFDTVHIVSHGTAGSLYLGTAVLNSSTYYLEASTNAIALETQLMGF